MKIKVSYEPIGYAAMSNKRVIPYVIGGALGCILIIGAMLYHNHKIDPMGVLIGIAVFAAISIGGYVTKLNTKFCWNNDKFTVLNFTGNAEKEYNWDDFKDLYTNDVSKQMSLVFNVNGKDKEIQMSMRDDGIDDLLSFIREKH